MKPPLLLCALALLPCPALADGALPDSLALVLPADRPQEIIAATNFGLLVSTDDGAHFDWICEQAIGTNAYLYQVGPAPQDVLYALSLDGLSYSTDDGCSWQHGDLGPSVIALDVFPAADDANRVFAIAQPPQGDAGFVRRSVYQSVDQARTFPQVLFTSNEGDLITGIELARSAPDLWATVYQYSPVVPRLAHSTDDGGTWTTVDLASAGAVVPRLLAVDPADPLKLYLRLSTGAGADALARWDDAAQSLTVVKQLNDRMTGFVRRADGSLLLSEIAGNAWSSPDGQTFSTVDTKDHLRALGERDGKLYALADNYGDGWAVGVSSNGGHDWTHLFQYGQLRGIRACGNLAQTCAGPWLNLKTQLGIGAPPADKPTGCGCDGTGAPLWSALLLVVAARRRRR